MPSCRRTEARAAVAADEILRAELSGAVRGFDLRPHAAGILCERDELASIPDVHTWQGLGHRLEQRLKRVLRDQLVGLERHRAICTGCDFRLRLLDRRVGQMQQRRLDERGDDEHVHGHVARKSGVADFLRDADAAIDFHGAGVAPLHLGQKLRRVFLLEQNAAHAAPAQVDGERQTHGAGADDENLRIQATIPKCRRIGAKLSSCAGPRKPASRRRRFTPRRDRTPPHPR